MNKAKITPFIAALFLMTAGQAMASGDVDIDLRCNSPSRGITLGLGNNSYDGTEKRYNYTYGSPTSGQTEAGYVDVQYKDVKLYALREDLFKANPNYYRVGMSGSGSEGWWVFSDSDSASFPPRQYHQHATPTASKNSAVVATYYGQIKITYKRHDGTSGEKVINAQIQKRECEAYNNGKWREVSPGRWEQQ
ncbi:MAG: hypothetical protein LBL45_12000 [Treponema sp.]|jgi:hypothetical protein|nr:hypothetical protein [Treponema sp.]